MKRKTYNGEKTQPLMDALLRRAVPLFLAAALFAILPPPGQAEEVKKLPDNWQVWIDQEVYPLITKEQREAFLKLESDAQRQAFAERLWDLWGRQTGHGVDFRQMYHQRLQLCREEFGRTTGLRARILLIQGPPDDVQESRCYQVFFPLQFWYWQQLPAMGQDVVVLFYQPNGVGPWLLWNSFEGRQSLYKPAAWTQRLLASSPVDAPENQCFDSDTLMILLGRAEYWGPDPASLSSMSRLPSAEEAGPESSSARFMDFSALLPDNAEPLKLSIIQEPLGIQGGKVQMSFSVSLASEELGRAEVGDTETVQLDVVGEISREGRMVDRFRYMFTVPAAPDRLDLLFERFIRPGDYQLRVKVEDVHSERAGVTEVEFSATPITPEENTKENWAP